MAKSPPVLIDVSLIRRGPEPPAIYQDHPQGTLSPRGDTRTWPRAGTHRVAASFYERTDGWQNTDGQIYSLTVRCFDEEDMSLMTNSVNKRCSLCYIGTRHSERLCAFMTVPLPPFEGTK